VPRFTPPDPAYRASQVGRGLRLSPQTGKEDCHIIDIVDAVNRSNGMLVSPTLWGLSHDEAALEQRQERGLAAETVPGK
jgi:ATP-dependent helicase IRC3